MNKYYKYLKNNSLFSGIDENNFSAVTSFLNAYVVQFFKNQVIRQPETRVENIGVIVSGLVYTIKTDINGNRMILNELGAGKSFGESLAFTEADNSPISILAAKDSTVFFFPMESILRPKDTSFPFYQQLLKNLIKLFAEKNMLLQMKNDILSQKTTKEKLLLYFEYESKSAGSNSFNINFSREELADFLSLNSSALSRELGKLRDEGILIFKKNKFTIKN